MRGLFLSQRYLFWRGLRLALLLRLTMLAVLLLSASLGGSSPQFTLEAAPAVVAMTMLVGWIESLRLSERVFLANLGLSPLAQSMWLGLGAIAAETALALVLLIARAVSAA